MKSDMCRAEETVPVLARILGPCPAYSTASAAVRHCCPGPWLAPAQLTACQCPVPPYRGASWPWQPQPASLQGSAFQGVVLVKSVLDFLGFYQTLPLSCLPLCEVGVSAFHSLLNNTSRNIEQDSSQGRPCGTPLLPHLQVQHNPLTTTLRAHLCSQFLPI